MSASGGQAHGIRARIKEGPLGLRTRTAKTHGHDALSETFFSPRFGMVADKFGVGWMVLVAQ